MSARRRARGFTLFEVAVSLFIASFSVTAVLLIFPQGLRQLEIDRFRLYAAAMANQLVDVYGNADSGCVWTDNEAPRLWDIPVDRRINAPDLETKCATHRFGLMPLPREIASRLDTDGDEIARMLDEGGELYYVQPNIPDIMRQDVLPVMPPNDLQKLVVGVVGSAQHNAAYSHPMKRWPYYAAVPGPPMHALRASNTWWNGRDATGRQPSDLYSDSERYICWQSLGDQRIAPVMRAYRTYAMMPESPTRRTEKVRTALGGYIRAASDYAATCLEPEDLEWLFARHRPLSSRFATVPTSRAAQQVLALNYLTHALQSLTRWHRLESSDDATGKPVAGLKQGVDIAMEYATGQGGSTEPTLALPRITHDMIVNLAENCRFEYYRFTAQHPYNWSVPRPVEHATMMDYSLLELDLFSPPLTGPITLAPGGTGLARQWRYMAPQPITGLPGDSRGPFGASLTYPMMSGEAIAETFRENGPPGGGESHYTLLRRFTASERCRELVFWMVDWQQYEDFETAPSAPLDASRYPKAAPGGVVNTRSFDEMMQGWKDGGRPAIRDAHMPTYRNPEKNLVFLAPTSAEPTGTDMSDHLFKPGTMYHPPDFGPPGKGSFVEVFNGRYGADRNGNRRLDRGHLTRSVRLRAQQVARVMYYDARVPVKIR